jgi:hypothetical protein
VGDDGSASGGGRKAGRGGPRLKGDGVL